LLLDPRTRGLGPVPAVRQALAHAGWSIGDVERVEINEAFAAIAIVVARELGFPEDIVNVEGGAVAHGHPIGATGGCSRPIDPLNASRRACARRRHPVHRRWAWDRTGDRNVSLRPSEPLGRLDGEIALVTGGNSGAGLAMGSNSHARPIASASRGLPPR
jgi:hypothetical protein